MTITIDGPAGTGKSSTARVLARRLGLEFLDTGAMYRAAAYIALQRGIPPSDGPAIALAVEQAHLEFDWIADPPRLLVRWPEEADLTPHLRGQNITSAAAIVAGCPEVRRVMVGQQRRLRDAHPRLVSEGRDQGSVVFPDAAVKFYLDAAPKARVRRRAEQLRAAGQAVVDEAALLADILQRDRADMTRSEGPLVVPHGAVIIDTTNLTYDEVLETLEREARARLPQLVATGRG